MVWWKMLRSRGCVVVVWLWMAELSLGSDDFLYEFTTPKKFWERNLDSDRGPGLGNGIVSSDEDARIFVTSTKGILTALQKEDGKLGVSGYEVLPTSPPPGWIIQCTSSPSLYSSSPSATFRSFVVYAYTNIPPFSSTKQRNSVVVIVSHNKNGKGASSVVKKSPELKGQVSGTPVISSDGNYIYVTHNLPASSNNAQKSEAFFTMLSADSGEILFQESAKEKWLSNQQFGPIGMAPNPIQGFYNGGEKNINDMLVWGPYPPDQYTFNLPGDGGYMYGFQLPIDYQKGQSTSSLATLRLANVQWTTTTAPTFSKPGQEMFVSVSYNSVVAWTQGQEFDDSKEWMRSNLKYDLQTREEPIYSAPTLIQNKYGFRILLSSTVSSSTYYGFNPTNGQTEWEISDLSSLVYSSPPVFSTADNTMSKSYAFLLESEGTIRKIDAFTGDTKWKYDFYNGNGSLLLSTATLSNHNQMLYVGGTDGRILALQVASLPPTISPKPTSIPTAIPTIKPNSTDTPILIRTSSVHAHPLFNNPKNHGLYVIFATISLYFML